LSLEPTAKTGLRLGLKKGLRLVHFISLFAPQMALRKVFWGKFLKKMMSHGAISLYILLEHGMVS
jgi:hypothetical protein